MMSLSTQTKNLCEELDSEIQEARIDIQITKTLVETMGHGLNTRLAEVEVRTEHGACRRTGTGVGGVKPPKFDRSTSWAVFHCQFEAMAEYNNRAPC
jgi:hypothetical protein